MTKTLSILILLMITACGKSGGGAASSGGDSTATTVTCANLSHIGVWTDNISGDVFTVNSDCTASNTHCLYALSFTLPNASGQTNVTVTNSNGAGGCYAAGAYLWTVLTPNSNTLILNSGNGDTTYVK